MSELTKFLFEGLPVRGMLVRLGDGWREMLARRQAAGGYPRPVRELLGEMSAAAALMQANIKFNGALVLQISGDGPVKLAVAEVQPDLSFRATATLVGEVPDDARLEALVNVQGQGRCVITLDPKDRLPGQQPYQGIVPLHGDQREPLQKVSEVLEHYMLQSEQLDTRLVLAADDSVAAGLLIQRLPVEGELNLQGKRNEDDIGQSEAFERISMLAATLTRDELLSLSSEEILHRLFWEETLRVFEPQQPRFACTCSAERVRTMLKTLGREESDSLIAERGSVEVGCQFCGQEYRFDAVDVGELFTPQRDQPPSSSAMQ
ncbi:redox-regulated molecular chaperone Hsp33 [Rubrivivax gelatinosus]|uniref:Redox-regulated molecular chaperone Hsp33 n=1 Tax=Rubrivivax gelatinosus TaxID=28068 RepID=A0ABS1DNZ8_RUBGE|nr:Hsp33 family molecular chaperone HslO [Rubrivivax gelatinosus]MBK1612712.1 redox-regulated molecular chaperone Hsp33 [Rubrivivax gelatinosus]MBK1711446.1 redox-regulated molecular chaperone Hsp33 [Rubrivivax gelatinosus]